MSTNSDKSAPPSNGPRSGSGTLKSMNTAQPSLASGVLPKVHDDPATRVIHQPKVKTISPEKFEKILAEKGDEVLNKVRKPTYVPTIKKPTIFYEVYGSSFGLDLLAVPHNAVRKEISDLYDVLNAMEKLGVDLTKKDVDDFFRWWAAFRDLIQALFDIEEDIIYPWITIYDPLTEDSVSNRNRIEKKNRIFEAIAAIDKNRRNTLQSDVLPLARIAGLPDMVEKLVVPLLAYFFNEERTLPRIVEKYYDEKKKAKVDQRIIQFLKKSELYSAADVIVQMTAWMNESQLRWWINNNLAGVDKTLYGRWKADFDDRHVNLIDRIIDKAHMTRIPPSQTVTPVHVPHTSKVATSPVQSKSGFGFTKMRSSHGDSRPKAEGKSSRTRSNVPLTHGKTK